MLQWCCPCGVNNHELRRRCRNCGEAQLPNEVLITPCEALAMGEAAGEIRLERYPTSNSK